MILNRLSRITCAKEILIVSLLFNPNVGKFRIFDIKLALLKIRSVGLLVQDAYSVRSY